jgi:ABC-type molybdenum transport system ATPase subunit/photorepair protein PhrA
MPAIQFKKKITREVPVVRSPRVQQMVGMFDVEPEKRSRQTWELDLTLPEKWNVGVIVGPSGCGKSTIAGEWFGDNLVSSWQWPDDKSILDAFPKSLGIKEIVNLLSSVGFSSPPAWVRPFRVLSNGEQFRVNLARTLAELPQLAVVDEFTSVVDRTVAQIGSAAVAKTVRRRNQKFIAVSCHRDVLDWLEPDWVYEPAINRLTLSSALDPARGLLWRRPGITVRLWRGTKSFWPLFKPFHYLSGELSPSARVFLATLESATIPRTLFGFFSILPSMGHVGWRRGHRTVVLPDFQGIGLGNRLVEEVAELLWEREHLRYRAVTSSPSIKAYRLSRPDRWILHRHSLAPASTSFNYGHRVKTSFGRLTTSWEYLPRSMRENGKPELTAPA